MKTLLISSTASNQGKTILTAALLHHYRNSVRPYKAGPDYIDPQFHEKISNTPSINLDAFIMDEEQVQNTYKRYENREYGIIEGVMGYYDGMDKGASAYDISRLLKVPTVLVIDGSGSYITISAVLKGMKEYRDDGTVKAVVLNRLSSASHFELIKKNIEKDFDDIVVAGWIEKDLKSLSSTHLGLDLNSLGNIEETAKDVLQHIDLNVLPFKETNEISIEESIEPNNKKLAVIKDENFSFLYHDNVEFLKEIFKEVVFVSGVNDERVEEDVDAVYIPGGYIETEEAYNRIKNSNTFKSSLKKHGETKPIYAECAGLLYLAQKVDDKEMAGILDVEFTLESKRARLGYYYGKDGLKGHAFHYTKPKDLKNGFNPLSKKENGKGEVGSWQKGRVYGTFLHTMFRYNFHFLRKYFGI